MITVWNVPLDSEVLSEPRRTRWLSADERERARRFRSPLDAQKWQRSRIALRELLGRATSTDPALLRFRVGDFGKPTLEGCSGTTFSLSHSGDVALVAIGHAVELGVDVELVRATPDLRQVAQSFFSLTEQESLARFSDDELPLPFFRCWTRKEAYVKALGTGIGHDLRSFAVSVDEAPPRLLHVEEGATETWSMIDLGLSMPYVGALAVQAPNVTCVVKDFRCCLS